MGDSEMVIKGECDEEAKGSPAPGEPQPQRHVDAENSVVPVIPTTTSDDGNGAAVIDPTTTTITATPPPPPHPALSQSSSHRRHSSTSRARHDYSYSNKSKATVWTDIETGDFDESGTPEEREAFLKELESFCKQHGHEFKPPKFYGTPLNLLKLWRAVIKLGGYEVATSNKLWRQVGESFHPPKTCTTVSWTFRIFYEKALLEYEKHKLETGELQLPAPPLPQSTGVQKETSGYQAPASGRARRDAAARAMQGWHAQRVSGYGEVGEPIIKCKNLNSAPRREKPLKSIGMVSDSQFMHRLDAEIVDVGPPADWVKINVRESKDCFEIYALVPGLLREEVRVQSDPSGHLVITGQPEHLDNPWGITPFKKVVNLPSRIDPLQTSAVVSLHGRLHVRVPFER
ncbi:AT-rich interactive domain-containing protein 5 [Turnera subulata]|uniref:AT-rich interactive domain-containing protein 5 n=1 Tax=Turnera subulata TaxID=218843 RepID=A0A9Q0G370_9ROSI|nr:AT-rich interactive domain-containing protein 5 [Turnera subulata]